MEHTISFVKDLYIIRKSLLKKLEYICCVSVNVCVVGIYMHVCLSMYAFVQNENYSLIDIACRLYPFLYPTDFVRKCSFQIYFSNELQFLMCVV